MYIYMYYVQIWIGDEAVHVYDVRRGRRMCINIIITSIITSTTTTTTTTIILTIIIIIIIIIVAVYGVRRGCLASQAGYII